ncbi:MAG: repeat protein [Pedosphaera sp.]|nr:repeat protein [Pedosphaera sp.]
MAAIPSNRYTMKMKRRFCITLAVTVAIIAIIAGVFVFRPHPPSYQNRSLQSWLADVDYGQPPAKREAAQYALRQMGTNVIPFLLSDFRKHDSRLTWNLKRLLKKQSLVHLDFRTPDERIRQATWAFDALGPLGTPAIPDLVALQEQAPGYIPSALAGIGPTALPALFSELTNHVVWVRDNAATAIANAVYSGKITSAQVKAAIPSLLANLKDPDANAVCHAIEGLGAINEEPELCVPALNECLNSTNSSVVSFSRRALNQFATKTK